MSAMFIGSKVKSFDLSSFDTSKVISMVNMFNYCSNLTTIYVSDKFVLTSLEA